MKNSVLKAASLLVWCAAGVWTSPVGAQEAIPVPEAMSDVFPDTLFVVNEPFEARRTIDLQRSGSLMPADDICLDESFVSRTGRVWFTYNNRGPMAGQRDALSVLIAKWKGDGAGARSRSRVSFAAYRNSNPWYRARVPVYFRPDARPLRNVTLEDWNADHISGRTARYDRLFGRRPGDRFHASPSPDGTSSSTDSAWWALPELENANYSELVIDARLLRFSRAGYDQRSASGVSFFLSPGDFENLLIRTRSDGQSISREYEIAFGDCSDEG